MTLDAPTNAGKHVTSNNACPGYQRYTDDSVFWLVQMMLCVMTILNCPLFDAPKHLFRWSYIHYLFCNPLHSQIGGNPKLFCQVSSFYRLLLVEIYLNINCITAVQILMAGSLESPEPWTLLVFGKLFTHQSK